MHLTVKVIPRAHKNAIAGFENGVLKVRLNAVPEKNQANQELIDFLADELGIPKSSITLVRGQTSRIKHLHIEGLTEDVLVKKISH
ncbi:MAG TPA: DUF167 domain-containing protein [Rhabdochlamydiaceae bacterium]|jgi:uncharacterized protein (TIGR00251 family)|nr:DUF167 domain-containing protein [Rhabdochlamydiaceae bacterium]